MNKVHLPQKVSYSVSFFVKSMLLSEFAKILYLIINVINNPDWNEVTSWLFYKH